MKHFKSREYIPNCPHRTNKKLFRLYRTISKREGVTKVYKCEVCGKVVYED